MCLQQAAKRGAGEVQCIQVNYSSSGIRVQFNSARIDTIPVLPHDLGWAVYDSDMKLPLTLNFGAARPLMCKTAGHKLCKHIMHLRFCWLECGGDFTCDPMCFSHSRRS